MTLRLLAACALAVVLSSCHYEEQKSKINTETALERIAILEKAQNSTDPYIQKQAEMIKQQIEQEQQEQRNKQKKEILFPDPNKSVMHNALIFFLLWMLATLLGILLNL